MRRHKSSGHQYCLLVAACLWGCQNCHQPATDGGAEGHCELSVRERENLKSSIKTRLETLERCVDCDACVVDVKLAISAGGEVSDAVILGNGVSETMRTCLQKTIENWSLAQTECATVYQFTQEFRRFD